MWATWKQLLIKLPALAAVSSLLLALYLPCLLQGCADCAVC